MRAYICMGIMCMGCIFSFWLGRNVAFLESEQVSQTEIAVMESMPLEESANSGQDVEENKLNNVEDLENNSGNTQEESSSSVKENEQVVQESSGNKEENADKNEEDSKKAPDVDKSSILLVNKDNRLPADYEVVLKKLPDKTNQAAEIAYQPMCDMINAARKEGLALEVCSSYRSVARQKELFEEDMRDLVRRGYSYLDAYDEVAKETMPPGYSEHATGLAFDIVSLGYQILDEKQEHTAESIWLREHCAEFGFILRYPKDKEDITKVSYESWHFRYVGVEVAKYIMENHLTLEEFLEEE